MFTNYISGLTFDVNEPFPALCARFDMLAVLKKCLRRIGVILHLDYHGEQLQ